MPLEFRLPELGEGIEEAEIAEILVREGDRIEVDQPVAELETEKAVIELPAPEAGVITEVHVAAGDTVAVGAVILTIEADDASVGVEEPPEDGSAVTTERPDPAMSETPSAAGVIAPKAENQSDVHVAASRHGADPISSQFQPPPPASPSTRRLARQLGVDLKEVTPGGPGRRIVKEDVERHVRERLKSGPGTPAPPPLPEFSRFGVIKREKVSKLNRTAAEQLSTSWRTIPHVTQHDLADITELEAVRKRYMQTTGEGGPKITVTAIVLKACTQMLSEMPNFNSSLDGEAYELILKQYYHIGVAVDTEHGLVVPVIRDADKKSILEIAAELTELSTRARNRKLTLAEMEGASFTVTNLGGIGGTAFTPIVNYPEVAILGLSRGRVQPAFNDGELERRLMLPLSLSYDHRVINGADAARFVVRLSALLSQPFGLLANI